MSKVYICDRCGRKCDGRFRYEYIIHESESEDIVLSRNYDYCEFCNREILDAMVALKKNNNGEEI